MAQARGLIPGTPITPLFPLARFRSPSLSGVAREFLNATTQPGDLVLEVGTANAMAVAEAVAAGRRIIALNRNPVELLQAAIELHPAAPGEVGSALTQLADMRKGDRPLIAHARAQYESACPQCRSLGVAEWFAWDRAAKQPFAKRVRCRRCGTTVEGPVDERDVAQAGPAVAAAGPTFYLALSKAAPDDDALRARVTELIGLYTARNLGLLTDILNRVARLTLRPEVRRVIDALVLEACDRGCGLAPYAAPDERPRSLRPPARFLEHNVWLAMEAGLVRYRRSLEAEILPVGEVPAAARSVPDLLARAGGAYWLSDASVQALGQRDLAGRVKGLILEIKPPDAVFWALSVLWATWIWGDAVPSGLRGFMRRRRLDWDWYARSLAAAVHTLRPLLHPEAALLAVVPAEGIAPIRAAIQALLRTELHLERFLLCPPSGARLLIRPDQGPGGGGEPVRGGATDATGKLCERILATRGEPTPRGQLEAACMLTSQDPALTLAGAGELDGAVAKLTTHTGTVAWLRASGRTELPLSDRVESYVRQQLIDGPPVPVEALQAAIYAAFDGIQSPDTRLVDACIAAYGLVGPDGIVELRPEDAPEARRGETDEIRRELVALGGRLGFAVTRHLNRDITWVEAEQPLYTFRCSVTALLGPHLLRGRPTGGGRPCLVLPGGRAALVALKVRQDPRLQTAIEEDRWTFIKFRHLRRMSVEVKERADIDVYLGLDPIVEQASAQIPLPFA